MPSFYFSHLAIETILICLLLALIIWLSVHLRRNKFLKIALEEITGASECGFIIFDKKGHLIKTNRKIADYFPFLIDQHKSYNLNDLFSYLFDHSVDYDKAVKNAVSRLNQNGLEYDFCEVVRGDKGRLCYVYAKKIQKIFTVFIVKDISQGQQREARMLDMWEHNKQLLQAVQASTGGILVTDPKGKDNPVVFYNKSLKNFLGDSYDEVQAEGWQAVFDAIQNKDEKQELWNVISKALDTEVEVRIKGSDKELKWFNIKISTIKNDASELDLVIGIFNETTLLKQREAQMSHVQKMDALGRLAAGIAHDFNNVLSIIDGFGKMASAEVEADSKADEYLERIQAASKRGASLTRKMLTFSKHKMVSNEVIDVASVVKQHAELLNPLLGTAVSLDIQMPDEEVPVLCSEDTLEQIIMNLVLNARDAMPEGGQITTHLQIVLSEKVPASIRNEIQAEEYACLKVVDTGTGMEKEVLEKIFDPFFTTKGAGKGTGLGMSVVYGLVNEIGGAIHITSVVGQGTCMEVYIPISENKVTKKIIGDESDLSKICLEGYTALVAEDEPDLRAIVSKILEDMGLNVLQAEDGDEALLIQEEHEGEIDILLTDVVMPGMNGVKLAELMDALSPNTKTIFMSGYPANGDMAPVTLPEKAYFIAKPVNYEQLAKLLLNRLQEGHKDSMDQIDNIIRWETTESENKGKTNAA